MMRPATDLFALLMRHSHQRVTRVDAYYNGSLTLANLPVIEGTIDEDDSALVKRELSLTVPIATPTLRLDPGADPMHPLNSYGQRLLVRSGIMMPGDPGQRTPELLPLGWFLITKWERDDEEAQLSIVAEDLAMLVVDAQLTTPQTPAANATFKSEITRMAGGLLPVTFDAALVDRALDIPPTTVWDRDRAGAIAELCDAWPARWYVDDAASIRVAPPYAAVTAATVPDVSLTDGAQGTITSRARGNERGRVYNTVVVRGATGLDGAAGPTTVLAITDPASPILPGGPFGPRPRFHTSDLIRTQAQADAAATALLDRYTAYGRAEVAGAVPDPRIQLGDVARVFTADGQAHTGRVTKKSLPLTAWQGGMTLTVSTLPTGDGDTRAAEVS